MQFPSSSRGSRTGDGGLGLFSLSVSGGEQPRRLPVSAMGGGIQWPAAAAFTARSSPYLFSAATAASSGFSYQTVRPQPKTVLRNWRIKKPSLWLLGKNFLGHGSFVMGLELLWSVFSSCFKHKKECKEGLDFYFYYYYFSLHLMGTCVGTSWKVEAKCIIFSFCFYFYFVCLVFIMLCFRCCFTFNKSIFWFSTWSILFKNMFENKSDDYCVLEYYHDDE